MKTSMKFRFWLKKLFFSVLPNSWKLRYLTWAPMFAQHVRQIDDCETFEERVEFKTFIHDRNIDDSPIDFFEFGVYEGANLELWTDLNTHPDSRFYGFDTFTGLPEEWVGFSSSRKEGAFSTEGDVPAINDSRVSLFKGLFQETLPEFLEDYHSGNSQLVIYSDSDLYSSTLYTLAKMDPYISEGTVIFLDDFSSVTNEFRALMDYQDAFMRDYSFLASCGPYFDSVALQIK